jgi:hypothetical protein
MTSPASPRLNWRVSSYTTTGASCVAVADAGDKVAVRNSVHPDAGTIYLERAQFADLLTGVKAGGLDHLANLTGQR